MFQGRGAAESRHAVTLCSKCGTQVLDGTTFCPQCGAPIAAAPPQQPQYPPSQYPPQQPYGGQQPYTGQPPYSGQQYAGQQPPCGGPQPGYVPPQQPYGYPPQPAASGLQENVAGLLCYLLGWLTGIIFLLIDKRPFVRFHAAQSIVVFGTLFVLRIILTFFWIGSYHYGFFGIHLIISFALGILTLLAWVILMIFAYQGKRYEVPLVGGIARSLAGSV